MPRAPIRALTADAAVVKIRPPLSPTSNPPSGGRAASGSFVIGSALPCDAGDLPDLHMYRPGKRSWTDLSNSAYGTKPSPRHARPSIVGGPSQHGRCQVLCDEAPEPAADAAIPGGAGVAPGCVGGVHCPRGRMAAVVRASGC